MLTVGSRFIGESIDVDYLGQGIVKHEELVIFVKGMLSGEVAEIEIKTLKKRFDEGKIVKIVKPSLSRREGVTNVLGSMDLYHMKDEDQLKWQTKLTEDTILKIAGIKVETERILTDHKFIRYRNKSVYHVMDKDNITLGLYHEDGRGLMRVADFLLADELTNHLVKVIHQSEVKVDFLSLKNIAFRTNEKKEALVTLVATKASFKGLTQLIQVLKKEPSVIGITLNIKDDVRKILGTTSHLLYGTETIDETLGDLIYPVTDQSFFQINVPVIVKAYDVIKSSMKPQKKVIDAYSGVGTIGFYLASKAKEMIMIESNSDAFKMSERMKETYGINHVSLIQGRAEVEIKNIDGDILVIDPPRNGLMPELVTSMIEKPFEEVYYVSCDLKTLARDLSLLKDTYNIQKVYPIRMFPQTTECETLVILHQKK